MKKTVAFLVMASVLTALLVAFGPAAAAASPTPPGQPQTGYGSNQDYICSGYTVREQGLAWLGTRVTCYVPNKLKNGAKAPVVIFLHGFKMVRPDFYLDFIKHLAYQGYIVIYPNINVGSLLGSLFDTDQNVFMQRALDNTNRGLSMVADKADLSDVTLFGHSLGALMASCWIGSGGVRPKALVLANVATDSSASIPIPYNPIDWKTRVKAVDVPVILLTGDRDTIAPSQQARAMYDNLTNAPSRVLYSLQTDERGTPALIGDHNMSLSACWIYPAFLMDLFFGGAGEVDATDWRFCWAALDAALDNQSGLTFDMGNWSDGVSVKPVVRLAPSAL